MARYFNRPAGAKEVEMREIYVKRDEDNNLELWVDGKRIATLDVHAALHLAVCIVESHASDPEYWR